MQHLSKRFMSPLCITRPETAMVSFLERNSPVVESSAAHKITNILSKLHTWTRQMFINKRELHSHKESGPHVVKGTETEGHANYST